MEHDWLPQRAPPICEHCCGPVEITSVAEITTTTRWPGCQGQRVFFHTQCVKHALPQQRPLDRGDAGTSS